MSEVWERMGGVREGDEQWRSETHRSGFGCGWAVALRLCDEGGGGERRV